MSEKNSNFSLQPNPTLKPLLHALDPISLILNSNSNSDQPFPLKLTSADSFIMERGPNYNAYAELRERRLRMRCLGKGLGEEKDEIFEVEAPKLVTPPRKQVRFQDGLVSERKGSSFNVAQSVPDFSAVLRKENRKPLNVNNLGSIMEMTPPPSKSVFSNGVVSSSRGSKSESAGEKKKKRVVVGGGGGGVLMSRKSYASFDELRSFSSVTATAINGEGRGGRNGRIMGKSVSGLRQF